MDLLNWTVGKVKGAVSDTIEVQKFIRRHRLIRDPKVRDRYYLSAARDRYIDADLSDPNVRESAETEIEKFRTKVTVRKAWNNKEIEEISHLPVRFNLSGLRKKL